MVERRDHILMIAADPEPRAFSAFFRRKPSTNGPFQIERDTSLTLLLLMAAAQDEFVRRVIVPRAFAFGRLAPRRDRMPAAGGTAFTAAMRMVDRVHRHTAHHGLPALPAHAARFADRLV